MDKNISIIGNGAYGTALAYLFGKKHHVRVFGRERRQESEHHIYEFADFAQDTDILIISIATGAFATVYQQVCDTISPHTLVILAMKWLVDRSLLPIDICRTHTPHQSVALLSWPGFAKEIMDDVPVHLIFAHDEGVLIEHQDFLLDWLMLDFSHDVLGVSWCGVLKNIYAIGAGMASLGGDFSREAYTESAVEEMGRLLPNLGGDSTTVEWPAGCWDMWICTTPHSRNFRYGAGEYELRDQAEGYRAIREFQNKFTHLFSQKQYPILVKIMSQMSTQWDLL